MIPSALGIGDGGEFRAPMAIGVIGGLVVSTLLSLVFVPSFYTGDGRPVGAGAPPWPAPARGAGWARSSRRSKQDLVASCQEVRSRKAMPDLSRISRS